ncbi:unnamed protein product [Spirodela intermedia]|uniref:Uncharacterized protein n=1 Tax=Spirodela intermedia TaxID=51605 RepID=A0A7I8I9W3_SPIIN|nr:unnamed protein product [Spirodela intermedia]CAA6654506.1 unnamed protein product [Spirodela intermedia]
MEESDPLRLEDYAVGPLRTLIYIPNFISAPEESQLLHHIYEAPMSKWKSLKNRRLQNWGGVVHEKGLLPQDYPPTLSHHLLFSTSASMDHEDHQRICEQTGLFPSPINHVLINEYLPNQGIMVSAPGWACLFPCRGNSITRIPAVVDFTLTRDLMNRPPTTEDLRQIPATKPKNPPPVSLLLMPHSLLIFKDEAYSNYLHGIEDSDVHSLAEVVNSPEGIGFQAEGAAGLEAGGEEQLQVVRRRATRVSLTCRLVPKVRRNLFKF